MNRIKRMIAILTTLFLVSGGIFCTALADDDHDSHKKKSWYQNIFGSHDDDEKARHGDKHKSSSHERKKSLNIVTNQTYKESCGACHFAYQPELLPSGSWNKILAGLGDHFGETIELDSETQKSIGQYLVANAAENSPAKRSVKITRSLGNQTPLRITEIPYILEKHHDVSSEILKRKSIGSLSNCAACHTTAENGIYDDDNVIIPKQ